MSSEEEWQQVRREYGQAARFTTVITIYKHWFRDENKQYILLARHGENPEPPCTFCNEEKRALKSSRSERDEQERHHIT